MTDETQDQSTGDAATGDTSSAQTGDTDAAATGDTTGTGAKGDTASYDWMGDGLSDEDRTYLDNKKFDSPRKVYDAMRAAEREVRASDKVVLPKDDPLKWDGWEKLGAPEKGDAYDLPEIEVPPELEGIYGHNADLETAMRGAMASARLVPEQASAMYEQFNNFQRAQAEAIAAESKQDKAETDAWMKENWGAEKDERLDAAITAAKNMGIEFEGENADILDRMALIGGSRPMLAIFDALAKAQAGDTPKGGAFGNTGGSGGGGAKEALRTFEAKNPALTNKDIEPEGTTREELTKKWNDLRAAARAEDEAAQKKR